MKDVKLVCEHGQPYGIRDWTGFLVFFTKVQKFYGQEERYREELAKRFALADDLEAFLRKRTDSTGNAALTAPAGCEGCETCGGTRSIAVGATEGTGMWRTLPCPNCTPAETAQEQERKA